MSLLININGKISSETQPCIPILDRGFLYGDSVYEVIRTYSGRPFAVSEHLDRLERSAASLYIDLPERRWLIEQIEHSIECSGNKESYCRIIVTRGSGPITLDPTVAKNPMTVMLVKELVHFDNWMYQKGVRLFVPGIRRNPPAALDPAIKSGNYLNSILALGEAKRAGFDDALLLGVDGLVTESTSANVFACRSGKLYTPALRTGILEGVTRGFIVRIAQRLQIECIECDLCLSDLLASNEVMLTGTLKEVMPVVDIGGKPIGDGEPGPVARKLLASLRAYALSETNRDAT